MAMADVFEHHQHDQARVVGGDESDKGTDQAGSGSRRR